MSDNNILLQSGTNEMEIIVFQVGEGVFGINVAKIQDINKTVKVTKKPNSHPLVKGIMNFREQMIPVIDLEKVLNTQTDIPEMDKLLIVVHINNKAFAFEVSSVLGSRRLSWTDIEVPCEFINRGNKTPLTGIINLHDSAEEYGNIIQMLDFEKIIADIDPSLGLKESNKKGNLKGKKIVVAEDSTFLMNVINRSLEKMGADIMKFNNGLEALKYVENSMGENIFCIISDIEMPMMDGFTFTRKVKENNALKHIPVILFSSLINENHIHKGESVGADAQITKPEIDKLADTILSFSK